MYHEAFTVTTQPDSNSILPLVHPCALTRMLLLPSGRKVGWVEAGGVAGTSAPVMLAVCAGI